MKLTIIGRIPSKKNSKMIVCRGKRPMLLPQAKYKDWHIDATAQLHNQKTPKNHKPSSVMLKIYFPDRRRADLTNKAESIMDLLVDNKVIVDDSWQEIPCLHLEGYYDKENPRVEITMI